MPQNNGRGPGSMDPTHQRDVAAEGKRMAHQTDDAEAAWDATEAVTGGRHGGQGTHHRNAAFHHETAAHHHREAAKHAGAGNHEDAKLHAEAAHTHGKAAREHNENARSRGHGAGSADQDPALPNPSEGRSTGGLHEAKSARGFDDDDVQGERGVRGFDDQGTGTGRSAPVGNGHPQKTP